jgi:GTP cyclohydrolase IA
MPEGAFQVKPDHFHDEQPCYKGDCRRVRDVDSSEAPGKSNYLQTLEHLETVARAFVKDESEPEYFARKLLESLPAWSPLPEDHRAKTPGRFVRALLELTTPLNDWEFTVFDTESTDMVTVGPIHFTALCAHHCFPFTGTCHIGYVPDGRIAGLSKFPRLVDQLTKGLWVQEDLTHELATQLMNRLDPKGVAVVMRAAHTCASIRGAKAQDMITTTARMTGVFKDHDRTAKLEFLHWIGMK